MTIFKHRERPRQTGRYNILAITFLILSALFNKLAWATDDLLTPGLWEGIDDYNRHYNLLEITSEGTHRLYRVWLSAKLPMRRYEFSNEALTCSQGQCEFTVSDAGKEETLNFLLSSGYKGTAISVMETARNSNGDVLLSNIFSLRNKKGESSFRSFLKRFEAKMDVVSDNAASPLSGLWIGTVKTSMANSIDILVLDATDATRNNLVRYFMGMNTTHETEFSRADMNKIGEGWLIKTTHPYFATSVILHKQDDSLIEGHVYSYNDKQLRQTGSFSLTKLER